MNSCFCMCIVDIDNLLVFNFQGMFCYWPPMAGASAKVKRDEIPDTEKWKLYEIRISSSAGMASVTDS